MTRWIPRLSQKRRETMTEAELQHLEALAGRYKTAWPQGAAAYGDPAWLIVRGWRGDGK